MVVALQTISDENISRLLKDPPLIWLFMSPDYPEVYKEAVAPKQPGFLARLFGAKPVETTVEVPELSRVEGEGAETDLDKSWQGIHYLINGTNWEAPEPLNFITYGGELVGNIDVGYGPARVLRSDQVAEIVDALADIDANTLRERFNPEEMMNLNIYPEIWDRDPADDDTLGYCIEYFEELKQFLATAKSHSLGVVIYLC